MKKLLKVALAFAMVATLATGCGAKANYAKAGLGVTSTYNETTGQVNTTFVALGLDADGKIAYIDLDVAQTSPGVDGKELDKTKEERQGDYGMKVASGIQKEWFEQAEAFEAWAKGKTPDEVVAVKTTEVNGHMVAKDEADLYAGCTMDITAFQEAVKKAAANAEAVEADTIKLGRVMANDAEKKQANTDLVLLALDADGKVVYMKWDVAQIYAGVTETKGERKEAYGMTVASPIKKEWFEQAAALEAWAKGKTVAEISGMALKDYHGGKAPADADLAAGVTITVDGPLAAIAKAK